MGENGITGTVPGENKKDLYFFLSILNRNNCGIRAMLRNLRGSALGREIFVKTSVADPV